jgi:hypothetical protein
MSKKCVIASDLTTHLHFSWRPFLDYLTIANYIWRIAHITSHRSRCRRAGSAGTGVDREILRTSAAVADDFEDVAPELTSDEVLATIALADATLDADISLSWYFLRHCADTVLAKREEKE